MAARIEVYEDKRGDWRWRYIAGNHRCAGNSNEGYENKGYVMRLARAEAAKIQREKGYAEVPVVVKG